MYIPDLSTQTYRAHGKDGFEYRSVGWLGEHVTNCRDTDLFVVAVLRHLWNVNQIPDDSKRKHRCEVCTSKRSPVFDDVFDGNSPGVERFDWGSGEFFVEHGSTRFVLPNLVLHYIIKHHYKLPDVVEVAILQAAVFTREDWEESRRLRGAMAQAEAQQAAEARMSSWFPDMGRKSMIATGDHVRAIGWLHPDRPHTRGEVPAAFVAKLRAFVRLSNQSTAALGWGVFLGFHTCMFCNKAHGIANFGIPAGDLLFVAPEMIVHYVEQHNYAPPPEFVAAVMASPLPDTPEYWSAVDGFRQIHRRRRQRW